MTELSRSLEDSSEKVVLMTELSRSLKDSSEKVVVKDSSMWRLSRSQ